MESTSKYLTFKGQIVFGKQSMPSFERMPKEYMENEACFVFINRGEVSVRAPHKHFEVNEKNGILAKCLNYFFETNRVQRENNESVEAIAVLLYPSVLEQIFDFDFLSAVSRNSFNIKQVAIDELLENFKASISILLDNPELADETIIENKLKEFVLLMARSQQTSDQMEFLADLFSPIDISFKSVIANNLYANLTLDELAKLCHMSTSSFKRKFREIYNDSPKKYISRKKIEKAAHLLKTKNERVYDIAYDVGFESIASFNRNFVQIYGKSPSEYRLS